MTTNATPESELLRTLTDPASYEAFRPFIKEWAVLPEVFLIIEDLGEWFKANPGPLSWEPFLAWSRVSRHPTWKPDRWDVYRMIVETAAKLPAPNPAIVERFRELDTIAQIRDRIETAQAKGGTTALEEISPILDAYKRASASSGGGLVEEDLDALLDAAVRAGGLEWRLHELNASIGPVREGDCLMVASRPEVGKTTFITDQFTYMAPQLPDGKHAIIFNNEEQGRKVKLRCVQSALDLNIADLAANTKKAKAEYDALLKGHRVDIHHDTGLTCGDVERRLRSGNYGLVAVNVLDKLGGLPKSLEGYERVRTLGIWLRTMADKYNCCTVGTLQADSTAEGVRYLNQSQIFGSKTGMQAESDALIMIGRDLAPGFTGRRFFKIARNKLPGGPHTSPHLRHGEFEVGFSGETGRFFSVATGKK
jgi:replicative DNA helicase